MKYKDIVPQNINLRNWKEHQWSKEEIKKIEYEKKLREKGWFEKKEEILERDNYTCQICGEKAEAVHHIKYANNSYYGRPEDAPNEYLVSLCNLCHSKFEGTERPYYVIIPNKHPIVIKKSRIVDNEYWDCIYATLMHLDLANFEIKYNLSIFNKKERDGLYDFFRLCLLVPDFEKNNIELSSNNFNFNSFLEDYLKSCKPNEIRQIISAKRDFYKKGNPLNTRVEKTFDIIKEKYVKRPNCGLFIKGGISSKTNTGYIGIFDIKSGKPIIFLKDNPLLEGGTNYDYSQLGILLAIIYLRTVKDKRTCIFTSNTRSYRRIRDFRHWERQQMDYSIPIPTMLRKAYNAIGDTIDDILVRIAPWDKHSCWGAPPAFTYNGDNIFPDLLWEKLYGY